MKRAIFTPFILLLLFAKGYAQLTGYKYEVSKKVYDAIASAYGNVKKAPVFVIIPKAYPDQISRYFPGDQPKIVMDEELYDICASFGSDSLNALATVLGHELAHHYDNHNWCSSFAFLLDEKDALRIKIEKISKDERILSETQADKDGGFYGYVAGYSTLEISSKLLDKIYTSYKLKDNITGYPSKDERKKIASTTFEELIKYQAVFDAGEAMLCLKENETASGCFEFLSNKFPSREMFGNAGFTKVLAAMDLLDDKTMRFALPLELDAGSRLKTGASRGSETATEENERQKRLLLEASIKYFDNALKIEPAYANALINEGCAYLLLNNLELAVGLANKIIMQSNTYNLHDMSKAYSLRAIALYTKGEKEKAGEDFEQAQKFASLTRNKYNLALYKELNKGIMDAFVDFVSSYFEVETTSTYGKEKAINPTLEKIDNKTSGQLTAEKGNEIQISSEKPFVVSYIMHENCEDLRINCEKSNLRSYSFLITREKYFGKTSQGVGKMDSIENIKSKYGEPTYTLNEIKGIYLVYRKSRIVFLLNQNNKITKWFTYY